MMRFYNFSSPNHLNEILEQPNPSLEDVLDEECVVSEVRNSNHKLVTFLCRKQIFDSLISYIIDIPSDMEYDPNISRKDEKMNKYPYVACEILSIDNDTIAQYFLGLLLDSKLQDIDTDTIPDDNHDLERADSMTIEHVQGSQVKDKQENLNEDTQMDIEFLPPIIKFLRFLNSEPPLNLTMAGYFSKVLRNLFLFKPAHMGQLLFEAHPKYLQKMALNIYSDSLYEVFLLILKLESPYFKSDSKEYYIDKRTELVQQLILNIFEKPLPSLNEYSFADLQTNSSNILVNLLINIECIIKGKEIASPLLQTAVLNKIIKGIADPSLVGPLAPLLAELCEYQSHTFAPKQGMCLLDLNHYTEPVSQCQIPEDNPFLLAIIDSVDVMTAMIQADNKDVNPQSIPFQYGSSSFCFGKIRMSMLDLIYAYVKLQNEKLSLKMISAGLLPALLNLLVKNPWNNILHTSLMRIFNFILIHGPEILIMALFEQTRMLDFIIEALGQSEFTINSKIKGKVTKGYIPYLHLLANIIEESKSDFIQKFCENHEAWQKFKNTELREANDKNNVKLGGEDALSTTRSLSGFQKMNRNNEEPKEAQPYADELDLNEVNYREPEEEDKLESDVLQRNARYEKQEIEGFDEGDIREENDSEAKQPQSVNAKKGFIYEPEGHDVEDTQEIEKMEPEDERTNKDDST